MDLTAVRSRDTHFSHPALPSWLLAAGEKRYLKGRGLVVNFNPQVIRLNNSQDTQLAAFSSVIRCNEFITPALSCLLFELPETLEADGNIFWEQQERYPGSRYCGAQTDVDFFRSPQDEIAELYFPPQKLTVSSDAVYDNQGFSLCANLWFADAGTHCGIHNEHSFIELHTQVLGIGRMQTFQNEAETSLCEDLILAPGATTSQAFCRISNQQYSYPFHQYYADTPSVWLALEYHPLSNDEAKNV
ncbi:hypothetical protein FCL49_19255 [Serratia proteamaculans]|uniref:hypothetical protein n=1 Tax=Serratia proteamaculans TaxID=28151 RepID=UPI001576E729|nr:hypothetical protein [Serratia proteamaculans]NTX81019.1 hypothetical protein [Serratia proteamaculans]NTZ30221.1 hypothetical protein [Serratia proteamaculans]